MGCAAVFSAPPQVGIAPSPRLGVLYPASPVRGPVVGGRELVLIVRRQVRVATARLGRRAPPGVARCRMGVARCWSFRCGVPFLRVRPGACRCALSLCATAPGPSFSWPFGGFLPLCCVAPGALSLWAPTCYLGSLLAPLPRAFSLPFLFPVWWWWRCGGACGAQGPHAWGQGCLEPPAKGFGGVGGAEALDRVSEEGFPCRLRHGGLGGGLVEVCGGGGADLLEGVHHVPPLSPFALPRPTLPIGRAPAGREQTTRRGGSGPGGGRLRAGGPGAAVAGAGGGGCVWAVRGAESAMLLVGGGGRGHGTAVARVAALRGAGALLAGSGAGGPVSVARGTGSAVLFVGGGVRRHGTAGARVAELGGAGASMAGAGDAGRAPAAHGTKSAVLFVGGGGCGHGTAVAHLAALGGAGASVAGAGDGGHVPAARGTGSAVLFVGGGGREHVTVVACVLALWGAGAAGAGPWGVMAAPRGAGEAGVSG